VEQAELAVPVVLLFSFGRQPVAPIYWSASRGKAQAQVAYCNPRRFLAVEVRRALASPSGGFQERGHPASRASPPC